MRVMPHWGILDKATEPKHSDIATAAPAAAIGASLHSGVRTETSSPSRPALCSEGYEPSVATLDKVVKGHAAKEAANAVHKKAPNSSTKLAPTQADLPHNIYDQRQPKRQRANEAGKVELAGTSLCGLLSLTNHIHSYL